MKHLALAAIATLFLLSCTKDDEQESVPNGARSTLDASELRSAMLSENGFRITSFVEDGINQT